MDLSYLDRSAGMRNFVENASPGSIKKFLALASEAVQPGSGVAQLQELPQTQQMPTVAPQAQQAPQAPQPPQPPGFMARMASGFIPGLKGKLENDYQGAVTKYASQLPYDQAVKYMATQDEKFLPMMLELADPVRKYQLEDLQAKSGGRAAVSGMAGQISKGGGSAPLGVRNNNPLNIRYSPDNDWKGQVGNVKGFAQFNTPEEGARAAALNMESYARDGINTVSGLVSRWAPPNENDTRGYVAKVAQMTGVEPDAPIDLTDPATQKTLIGAMQNVELGPKNAFPMEVISRGVDMAHQGSVSRFKNMPQPEFANPVGDVNDLYGKPDVQNPIGDPNAKPEYTYAEGGQGRPKPGATAQFYLKLAEQTGDPAYFNKAMDLMNPQAQTELGRLKSDVDAGYVPQKAYDEKLSEVTRGGTENIPGFELAGDYKPSQQDTKEIKAIAQARNALTPLFKERREIIARNPSPYAGTTEALDLDQNTAQISLEVKGLYQTGALDKGSMDVIMKAIGNPVIEMEWTSPVRSGLSAISKYQGGSEFAGGQIDKAEETVNRQLEAAASARGYRALKDPGDGTGLTDPAEIPDRLFDSEAPSGGGWSIERVR